ncbi:phosphoribosyltransferase family protein [Sanguibacter sp. 25GB23B1]|uniref:phosphoribosyltransferase n=1 Tax=unclassified Sanguibacter TaxID=2645534 RepID=UPI0032AEC394
MRLFEDRADAGRRLAGLLEHLRSADVVVLGLPRGGVPVAAEVARALRAPLDVVVVRKLGVPDQPELAMGAVGEGDVVVLDARTVARAGVSPEQAAAVERRERVALAVRAERLRAHRPGVSLAGRTVVVVDDGIATGATVRVACRVARRLGAARVVVAVPLAPPEIDAQALGCDELVCAATPSPFVAVGHHYEDFFPTSDDEVVRLLGG